MGAGRARPPYPRLKNWPSDTPVFLTEYYVFDPLGSLFFYWYSRDTTKIINIGTYTMVNMSRCQGEVPVTCKVDESMAEFVDSEAQRCGVSRAELLRRILDDYRDSRAGELACPSCGQELHIDPCP